MTELIESRAHTVIYSANWIADVVVAMKMNDTSVSTILVLRLQALAVSRRTCLSLDHDTLNSITDATKINGNSSVSSVVRL